MAAFQFPDPAVTQTVKNPTTGNTYQWKEDPGKWVLTNASDAFAADLSEKVSKDGDTMTGPLNIMAPAEPLEYNTPLLRLDNTSGDAHSIFEVDSSLRRACFTVSDGSVAVATQHFQIFTPGPMLSGGRTGFSLKGKPASRPNIATGDLLSQIRNSSNAIGDSLRYDGLVVNDTDMVNKVYVDTSINNLPPIANLLTGGAINGAGGTADTSGSLIVKQSVLDAHDGRIYLKNYDNTTNISLYGATGGIDLKGNLSFNSTNTNKNIRAYGASFPVIKFLIGAEASSVVELMSIQATGVTVNTNFTSNYGVAGQNIVASGTLIAGANLNVGTTSLLTGAVTAESTLLVKGNTTIRGTAKFTNQTAVNFEYEGDQSILTKDDILIYGLKADNSKPSWEACRIGIDPNNENFSAFSTGKRFYWTGTYAYLNGSLRNYLNGWTWDFRNNDTNNAVVLSISGSAVTYNGSTTGSTSIQTKQSVDAAISSNLLTYVEETDTLGESYLFQNHANNVGSTLDGFFLFEYSKSSTGMVNIIVNAIKTSSIVNGDVVGTLPEGYRPTSGRWPVFTLINQNKDTTAQCVVTDDGKVTFIQVSGASTKFIGQLTFSTHSG